MIKFWKAHSLSIVLAVIFVSMIIASWPLGYALLEKDPPYWKFWLAQTIITCEPDFGAMLFLVLVSKTLKERGSPQSKPSSIEVNGGGRRPLEKD